MFADLSRETRTLLQQEIELAKTELAEKAFDMGKSAALVVAGALAAYGGFLAILAAIISGLVAIGLPAWAAALVVGALLSATGYFCIRSGLSGLHPGSLAPRHTVDTLKEDAQWIKSQTR
jgi:drug/metabolite transporter (DMT)-like permease